MKKYFLNHLLQLFQHFIVLKYQIREFDYTGTPRVLFWESQWFCVPEGHYSEGKMYLFPR